MGKGDISGRTIQRGGPLAAATAALGKIVTARTQVGPIRYANKSGGEYCTISYLAVGLEQPHNVKQLIAPLLGKGGRVTHGTTHEPLKDWNLVVDISKTREETMALPQRIDFINDCLHLENVTKNTVLLAVYTGVTPEMDMMHIINQATKSIKRFHLVLVCMKSLDGLWQNAPAARAPMVGRGGAVITPKATTGRGGAASRGGRGIGRGAGRAQAMPATQAAPAARTNNRGGRGTPSAGRGAGGRVAGAGRGGGAQPAGRTAGAGGKGAANAGGKGGKGKGAVQHLGDGLTKRIGKDGKAMFTFRPY